MSSSCYYRQGSLLEALVGHARSAGPCKKKIPAKYLYAKVSGALIS